MKADLQRGDTLDGGRYEIDGLLGAGGQGQVYKAVDTNRDCIVAIKKREAESERLRDVPRHREDFEREAKLLSNLIHPALPRVIHHFFEDEEQYFVMDFIEGDDLEEALKKRSYQPFDVDFVLAFADKLTEALNYLHSRPEPIIHRDIKPQNIKVTRDGYVYLLDFGLAKGAAGQMATINTDAYSAFGRTPAYAPLEQLNGSRTSAQSDLYSLGATLYRVLTGRPLTSASERNDNIDRGHPDPLVPLHQVNPEVPASLSTVVSQAMAINRKDRTASAREMREGLHAVKLQIESERTKRLEEARKRELDEQRRIAQEEERARLQQEELHRRRAETERLELESLLRQQEVNRQRNMGETARLRALEDSRRRYDEVPTARLDGFQNEGSHESALTDEAPREGTHLTEPGAAESEEISLAPYVLRFGLLYIGSLSIVNLLVMGFQWNLKGAATPIDIGIMMTAAILTTRKFYKRYGRPFTKSERFRVVCYSFIVMLLAQTIAMILFVRLAEIPADAVGMLAGLTVVGFFGLLTLIGGFGAWGNRMLGIKRTR